MEHLYIQIPKTKRTIVNLSSTASMESNAFKDLMVAQLGRNVNGKDVLGPDRPENPISLNTLNHIRDPIIF